jgi:phosphoribosylformylglycinamidine synthase
MRANAIVLRTAGTNCDVETEYALHRAGAHAERVHVNVVREHPERLAEYNILVVPGGFSYGDDLGAGKILANELLTFLREPIRQFIDDGKLVLGICNGFQVLVKTGLLPGLGSGRQEATLTWNDSNRFEDRWVHLKLPKSRCVYTDGAGSDGLWYLPIAHAEGKFIPSDDDTLKALRANGQIVFQYVDAAGGFAGYPANPNGSVEHIAGVCDTTGRILGLMPHPERHILGAHHPQWTRLGLKDEGDGLQLFRGAVQYVETSL